MKESYTVLPVPAGDVSGIASALYELQGMVVIHDPSGCNSTYNTHDELRWYDKESDIFISGLNMRDAVLGNDKKFIADIVEAATELEPKPKFIAICNSPVPFLNGTDFEGICRIVEKTTGIPTFYVKSNGMYDYIAGVKEAYLSFAKKFFGGKQGDEPSTGLISKGEDNVDLSGKLPEMHEKSALLGNYKVSSLSEKISQKNTDFIENLNVGIKLNILGATPLDYGNKEAINSLKNLLKKEGFEVNAVWSLDTSFDEIMRTINSDINLVISSKGIPLAEYLEERYNMPYIVGAPVTEKLKRILCDKLRKIAVNDRKCQGASSKGNAKNLLDESKFPFSKIKSDNKDKISIIIGESVLSESLAAGIREEHEAVVLCPYSYNAKMHSDKDTYIDGEEELVSAIRKVQEENPSSKLEVIADPLYKVVIPDEIKFIENPTLAISGRRFKSEFWNYFELNKNVFAAN